MLTYDMLRSHLGPVALKLTVVHTEYVSHYLQH